MENTNETLKSIYWQMISHLYGKQKETMYDK